MTSMEAFGPVSPDYFNQRRVEDVIEDGDDAVWTIRYEGGGLIHNYDPTIPAPKAIKGAAQTLVVMGGHAEIGGKRVPVTELRFGLEVVKLNPLEYAMVDPAYTRGEVVYAQRSEANMPSTPPHPDERIAEGPTDEE